MAVELIIFTERICMAVQLNNPRTVELTEMETDLLTLTEHPYSLIVWNDEVNTFEWVIETLMDICHHTTEQAEQCAMIIHTQGKYAVKQGTYEELKPMCDAITERGIGATIEVLSEF
jgi:ATP-dependent Clp protease adaptor protein ClpS